MGNRGRLHDENRQLGTRRWSTQSWVTCALAFNGWKREIMSPEGYTELFFLDEATALSAGHRPCGECRREDYQRFKSLWLQENGEKLERPSGATKEIDRLLHRERVMPRRKKVTWSASLVTLPDGVMVTLDGNDAWLVWGGHLNRWTPEGYTEKRETADTGAEVLTPRSVTKVIAAGCRPVVHESVALSTDKII